MINSDPYGAGWLVELKADDPAAVEALLDAAAYRELDREQLSWICSAETASRDAHERRKSDDPRQEIRQYAAARLVDP